jgi:hypothetical protein
MEYRDFHFCQTAAPRRGWIGIAQIDGKERRGTGFDRADAAANPQRYIDRWIYINSEYGLK